MSEVQLDRDIDCWKNASTRIKSEYGDLPEECRHYFIIRCLIDEQVQDVVQTTEANIKDAKVTSADDVRQQSDNLVAYSKKRQETNLQLRTYLYNNLYFNSIVHEPHKRATLMVGDLFRYYQKYPNAMDSFAKSMIIEQGMERSICDHLACMTDRTVILEHDRLIKNSN